MRRSPSRRPSLGAGLLRAHWKALLAGLFAALASPALAGGPPAPSLLADLATGAGPGGVGAAVTAASSTTGWFVSGRELWTTDGTPAGTSPVFSFEGTLSQLKGTGPLAFFVVDPFPLSRQLWRSDGTDIGTVQLLSFPGGAYELAAGDGCVYLSDWFQIWFSDGTPAGTRLVRETTSLLGRSIAVSGTTALFSEDGHLWTTDGTPAGTRLVKDLTLESRPAVVDSIVWAGATAFFGTTREDSGGAPTSELWRTDGTEEGTVRVRVLSGPAGSGIRSLTPGPAGSVHFVVTGASPVADELWTSDGTEVGTTVVFSPEWASIRGLVHTGGRLFFSALNSLWVRPGSAPVVEVLDYFYEQSVAGAGGLLYFARSDPSSDAEPWRSDGTPGGTFRLADLAPGAQEGSSPRLFVAFGGRVLFATAPSFGKSAVWVSDGSSDGTVPLTLRYATSASSFPRAFTHVNGRTFFTTLADVFGTYAWLWVTEGTAATTTRIGMIPGPSFRVLPSGKSVVIQAGNSLYAVDGSSLTYLDGGSDPRPVAGRVVYTVGSLPAELRSTDGTADGTRLLHEGQLTVLGVISTPSGRRLLFATWESDGTYRLRRTDGTPGGTSIALDLGAEAPGPSTANETTVFWKTGTSVWASDGTVAGTIRIENPGPMTAQVDVCGATAYFSRWTSATTCCELIATDGTVEGTRTLASGSFVPVTGHAPAACLGDRILTAPAGRIWYSDGTSQGTREVLVSTQHIPWIQAAGDRFLFSRDDDEEYGRELWTSDGTVAGTTRLKDIAPGAASSTPTPLRASHGRLWFSANDGLHGNELWTSDGTTGGTTRSTDMAPGARSSRPSAAGETPSALFFSAFTEENGTEPWILPLPSSYFVSQPCRLVDTRSAGPPLRPGELRRFQATGLCGIAPTARVLSVNLTAVEPTADGQIASMSDPDESPDATPISLTAGRTRAASTFLLLDATGGFTLEGRFPSGTTHVLVDISGYLE